MQVPPIPANEADRLRALEQLQIMDSEYEALYDEIVQLAAAIADVPMAAIGFIDADRQWQKAQVGGIGSCPRELTFCGHTIVADVPLIIADARTDARFFDNPAVTQHPHIRFYAGHKLETPSGYAVGTLCVMDDEPRELTEEQLAGLRTLSRQAASLLELRLRTRELEQAEFEAREARERAEAANRAKSEFLASMSHELRTPLNSIIGFARVVRRRVHQELRDADATYLERVESNGRHLLGLIDDLLDLAKVEAGRMQVAVSGIDLGVLVREMLGEMEGRTLTEDGSAAPVQLIAEVPEATAPIDTDRARLKQVLINLVGNALKFTPAGSVTVRVVNDEAGVAQRIDVVDTGIGIPTDRQAAIFDAFEQARGDTAATFGGTGLGLAISKAFAELLGYRIVVRSVEGAGSTFSVVLHADAPLPVHTGTPPR